MMGRYYALHDGEPREVADAIEAALPAALRRRRAAGASGRLRRRARRQARNAGRPVRHRPGADRRQGSVRPAPRRARRDAHPGRRRRLAAIAARLRARPRRSRASSTSARAAICASRAIPRTRSRPCSRSARSASIWCRGSSRRCARSRRLPEAESLAAANKRIGNILKQAGTVRADFDAALLVLPEEKALAGAFKRLQEPVEKRLPRARVHQRAEGARRAEGAGRRFFDKVMVMAKDAECAPTASACWARCMAR